MYPRGFRPSVTYIYQGCIPRTAGLHPKSCRAASRELQGYIPNIFTLHQIDMTGAGIDPSLLRCSEPCINHTLTQIRICGYQYL